MSNDDIQNNKQGFEGLSFANNKLFYISSLALFGSWLVFCWQGLTTVVEIWYGNEIFNHGFFIVPGAFYLIYLKRFELLSKPIQTSPLALIVIIPALLLYVIGIAADIQLFLHAATFTLLPALIWLIIGTGAAKTILFPLVFMLFSIPVGEQLIPYLQEIAADGSVALLRLTGVPLFRSGLYIEIPQGRFLVAEACSGVSFFIASFVIGSLYAYLNLVSVKRRALFVITSLIFPVLANIVRVYGIILIAYWTDMEHAAGADHLIYGWFFFAFVIVCLLGIGQLMSEIKSVNYSMQPFKKKIETTISAVFVTIAIVGLGIFWLRYLNQSQNFEHKVENVNLNLVSDNKCKNFMWSPVLKDPTGENQIIVPQTNCKLSVYTAWFDEIQNELASDLHKSFDANNFSVESTSTTRIDGRDFRVTYLVSLKEDKVAVVTWYELGERVFTNKLQVKAFQIWRRLNGEPFGGRLWMAAALEGDVEHLKAHITEYM